MNIWQTFGNMEDFPNLSFCLSHGTGQKVVFQIFMTSNHGLRVPKFKTENLLKILFLQHSFVIDYVGEKTFQSVIKIASFIHLALA